MQARLSWFVPIGCIALMAIAGGVRAQDNPSPAADSAVSTADLATEQAIKELSAPVQAYDALLTQIDSDADQYTYYYTRAQTLGQQALAAKAAGLNARDATRLNDYDRLVQQRDDASQSARMWLDLLRPPAVQAARMFELINRDPALPRAFQMGDYTRARSLLKGVAGANPDLRYIELKSGAIAPDKTVLEQDREIAQLKLKLSALEDDTASLKSQLHDNEEALGPATQVRDLLLQQLQAILRQPTLQGSKGSALRNAALAPLEQRVHEYNGLLHQAQGQLSPEDADTLQNAARLLVVITADPLYSSSYRETGPAIVPARSTDSSAGLPPLHLLARR